jgi:hypothetical protein
LVAILVWNVKAKIVGFKTELLHWDLKKEIFMEIPEGMDDTKKNCLYLNKGIYALVQSVRQFLD